MFSLAPDTVYYADGEPDNAKSLTTDRPVSVFQAVINIPSVTWRQLAEEIFKSKPYFLTAVEVMERIKRTDTRTGLGDPAEIWIDSEGKYRVLVYRATETATLARR